MKRSSEIALVVMGAAAVASVGAVVAGRSPASSPAQNCERRPDGTEVCRNASSSGGSSSGGYYGGSSSSSRTARPVFPTSAAYQPSPSSTSLPRSSTSRGGFGWTGLSFSGSS